MGSSTHQQALRLVVVDPDVMRNVELRVLTQLAVTEIGDLALGPTTGRSPRVTSLALEVQYTKRRATPGASSREDLSLADEK